MRDDQFICVSDRFVQVRTLFLLPVSSTSALDPIINSDGVFKPGNTTHAQPQVSLDLTTTTSPAREPVANHLSISKAIYREAEGFDPDREPVGCVLQF